MEFGASTTTATLTKKLSNGYGVSGRSAYDGVFATPIKLRTPSFSPQFDDYGEIFGGSGASSLGSSIPILELPELNERRTMDDVRRSKLDYSKVFGGFGNLEAAVPFEEVDTQPKDKNSFTSGAPKRSKVKSGNQSCWEDHTNCSREIPVVSRLSNDAKKINLSYHRVNQGSENGTNGTTHIAQFHAVPAYTCLIGEVNSVKMNRAKMSIPVVPDTHSGSQCSEGIKEGGHCTESFTGPSPNSAKKQSSNIGEKVKSRSHSIDLFYDACENSNGSNAKSFTSLSPDNAKIQSSNDRVKVKSRSDPVDLFYDACEISNESNGIHHAKVAPSETMAGNLDNHIGDAMRSIATKCQASKSGTSEGAAGADSPSYLDDMVDSNSAAAASVAALRKAIEEAQVRMKVAKESMRRKKEGLPDRVKRKSNVDSKAGGEKEAKLTSKAMKLEKINTRQTIGEMDALPQVSSEGGKPVMRIQQLRSNHEAKEMSVAEEAVQEVQKKLKSSQAGFMQYVEQKEADHTGEVIELKEAENTKKVLFINSRGRNASEKLEKSGHTIELVKECWEQENNEEKVRTDDGVGGYEEPVHETKHRNQEVVDETKLMQETLDNRTTDKRLMVNEDREVENNVTPFHEPKDYESNLGGQGLIIGNEKKVTCKPEEDGKMVDGSFELEEFQRNLRAIPELGGGENITQEQKGSEDKAEVSCELEECELTEFVEPVDNERVCSPHGSDIINTKKEIEDLGCLEDIKGRNESDFLDINQEREHSCQRETTDNTVSNIFVQEILEDIVDHIHDDKKIYEKNTMDGEFDGNWRVQDAQENENEIKGATQQIEENEAERKDNKVPVKVIRVTQADLNCEEIKAKEAGNTTETISSYEPDETGKLSKTQIADTLIENDETLKATLEIYSCDVQDDAMVASNTSFQCEGACELNEAVNQMQNTFETVTIKGDTTNSGETDMKARLNQDHCLEKAENDCNLATHVEETTPESLEICNDAKEARDATNIGETDMKAQQNHDQCLEKAEDDCNPAMLVEETTPESVDTCKAAKEARVALDEEIDESQSNTSNEEILSDNEHSIEASHIPSMSEWKTSSFSEAEVKSIDSNLKESCQASMGMEEKEANGNLQKVELEKEHRKKIDEAKEREREREKEKLAVERAIREVRERAFAEARERAALERAAAEARQKNISDVRERLGKTTSQANEKTPAEKAAMEAKLKAERAAVERATQEARARALERALSEKAASEARNRSDKSAGTSRDNGMKQNFYSKSFSYGVRNSTDVYDGANGDSAQRCKARSERHQRIGERVAKALAEKNMRDWLVQKEQEDRNRVAEALDADVRRWSSGKAGNLRALLSTLQYILGPDSGWQPIPLTDIVTTTAVKKAYRKATLFVHPDKLQQRGASIQQKYTCEKVFDLLKEAWNRFNMEER